MVDPSFQATQVSSSALIYSKLGNFRVIRELHHLQIKGAFHDMKKDPLQLEKVNPSINASS